MELNIVSAPGIKGTSAEKKSNHINIEYIIIDNINQYTYYIYTVEPR
jgi:hypothetical protein